MSAALPRYTSSPALTADPEGHWRRAVPSSTTAAPGSGTDQLVGLTPPTHRAHNDHFKTTNKIIIICLHLLDTKLNDT